MKTFVLMCKRGELYREVSEVPILSAYLHAVKFKMAGKPLQVDLQHKDKANKSILIMSLQTHYCGSLS